MRKIFLIKRKRIGAKRLKKVLKNLTVSPLGPGLLSVSISLSAVLRSAIVMSMLMFSLTVSEMGFV